jgi:hypothetical protein
LRVEEYAEHGRNAINRERAGALGKPTEILRTV